MMNWRRGLKNWKENKSKVKDKDIDDFTCYFPDLDDFTCYVNGIEIKPPKRMVIKIQSFSDKRKKPKVEIDFCCPKMEGNFLCCKIKYCNYNLKWIDEMYVVGIGDNFALTFGKWTKHPKICMLEKHGEEEEYMLIHEAIPIEYCPFCGAKIEYEEIRDDKYIN